MKKRFQVTTANHNDVCVWLMGKRAKNLLSVAIDLEKMSELDYLNHIVGSLTTKERNLLSRAASAAKKRREKKTMATGNSRFIQLPESLDILWSKVARLEGLPKSELLLKALSPYIDKYNIKIKR